MIQELVMYKVFQILRLFHRFYMSIWGESRLGLRVRTKLNSAAYNTTLSSIFCIWMVPLLQSNLKYYQ